MSYSYRTYLRQDISKGRLVSITHALAKCLWGEGWGREDCERVLCIKYVGVTPLSFLTKAKHKVQAITPRYPSGCNPPSFSPSPPLVLPSAIVAPFICLLFAVVFVVVVSCHCLCLLLQCLPPSPPPSPGLVGYTLWPTLRLLVSCLFSFLYFEHGAHYSYTKAKAELGVGERAGGHGGEAWRGDTE